MWKELLKAQREPQRVPSDASSEACVENKEVTELRSLGEYYMRRKRPGTFEKFTGKRGMASQLDQAYKLLAELGEPLKLFGETPADVIHRAKSFSKHYEGQVYASVPAIDLQQHPNDLILSFLRTCLSLWGEQIVQTPLASAPPTIGTDERSLYASSQKALEPLMKALANDRLDGDIRDKMGTVVRHCIQRDYGKAHDAYILLSIGNAAWPMGVTMVGIHERVGRSRIASSEIAHVLNDETTCRFIQVFKRLMTLCQSWDH